jgi:thiol:disulfide interchange protein DsbD
MALLFVVIALNFAGLFEFGLSLTRLGQLDPSAATHALQAGAGPIVRSFGSGALAVLVATPCTAPFMGSALGYTIGQPAAAVLLVFTAIAIGMALPYLVLGFFPALLAWLPRPGRWMESLRQFLAFPMLATAAWLSWVLGQQAGIDAVLALAMGAVFVALAGWLYGRFVQGPPTARRGPALGLALATLVGGTWLALSQAASADPAAPGASGGVAGGGLAGAASKAGTASSAAWQTWSEARVAEALAAGRPVFVDFTAAWCVSCQANKRLALERASVRSAFEQAGVVRLKADWTQRDPLITAALARHGRNGVPLYLLYSPGRDRPEVLPELLTPGIVLGALADLRRAL